MSADPTIVPPGRLNRAAATGGDPGPSAATPSADPGGGRPRVYVETYGCQMNVADSDLLLGLLGRDGMQRTEDAGDADVILINTCAVREKAEDRVLARARELAAHKRRRPGVVLAVTGCMAEHLKESLAERAPWVDVIAGPDSYRRVPGLLAEARQRGADQPPAAVVAGPLIDVQLDRDETYDGLSGVAGGDGVSGFVTIQRGCDKFCTFCVVPFTRGRERGVAPREVLRQVRAHAAAGYREVVLLGQTVNSYRWSTDPSEQAVGFAELLRAVARVDGIERVRFTSPYPVDFTAELIEVLASEPRVCKYVHLPLQSGSDAVLSRMRRGYDVAGYRRLVADLRAAVPGIALSTDILSGFCGETDDDHRATLALMEELRFDSAFMFVYSERDLTFAAKKLADDVAEPVKKQRIREIVAVQERISAEINAAQVGRRERVLIHSRSRRSDDQVLGRTDGFKAVVLPAAAGRPGDLVDVDITGSTMATLFGR